ncbi:MAG: hypothetical protein HXS52_03645 [Theionarchaea archaeon]|nr:hypothetical protein [Theionarchaea archaeon]MBU7037001.1 hypothetical protein [Theionarchaea archaeon]
MIRKTSLRRSDGGRGILLLDEDMVGPRSMVSGFLLRPFGDTRPDPD